MIKEKANDFVSIKTKIILIIGALVTLLLVTISLSVLYQWRGLIIEKLEQRAYSVTLAFSVSVIDVLIYEDNNAFSADDFLENYIIDFIQKDPSIEFITIYDNKNRIVSHSNPDLFSEELSNDYKLKLEQVDSFTPKIYESDDYGWVLESFLPLKIGGKRWGVLRIGFDADGTREEIRSLFIMLLTITVIGNIIILMVLYILTNQLTSSLRKLVMAMDTVDLESKPHMPLSSSNDEIGYLIYHFDEMQKRLTRSQKKLINVQSQVHQAEKLASIGRLVSGIAHEINNPLNGIKSCIYTIKKEPDNHDQLQNYLDLITEGLNHIEMIVQKLLGFARQPSRTNNKDNMIPVNVNESIQKTLALLAYKLDKNQIEQSLHLDDTIPPIKIDQNLLQEILMNLIINSFDALNDGGILTITTSLITENEIKILIKDNGPGIEPENLKLIFEPFFKTKDVGEGTGLGLSVSKGIVEAHGGTLKVSSVLGKETVFSVCLPVE